VTRAGRAPGRRGKPGGGCGRAILVFLAVLAGVLLWIFWPTPPPAPSRPEPTPTPAARPTAKATPPAARPLGADFEPAREGKGVVALVIDDVGYEESALSSLATLDGPLAISVLPSSPHAREAAALANKKKWDLMVHLPMDSAAGKPEKDSVGEKDSDDVIRERLAAALEHVPGAIGLNNHQGSTATADARVMRVVLRIVKERSLFFLDSRTTAASVAPREARALGIAFLERDVFLDDAAAEAEAPGGVPEALESAWKKALGVARKKGHAIVIGHPHPATLEFLAKHLPELANGPIHAVRVSELID
jgi:polysaccharide deacetylase 2 family uncharacterized protein YibQ